jgi:hypothetical protein
MMAKGTKNIARPIRSDTFPFNAVPINSDTQSAEIAEIITIRIKKNK